MDNTKRVFFLYLSVCTIISGAFGSSTECPPGGCMNNCNAANEFRCGNTYQCIPRGWICDNEDDCDGGEDESNCNLEAPWFCTDGQWRCNNGHCIDPEMLCDVRDDCGDGSDELPQNCPTYRPYCPDGLYYCGASSAMCIPFSWVCDGSTDCPKGEDEVKCDSTSYHTCSSREFECVASGMCIHLSWMCDGEPDCDDSSDEATDLCNWKTHILHNNVSNILSEECSPDMYHCTAGSCIPMEQVCDGLEQCTDGSDENGDCSTACITGNGGCSHECQATPTGQICNCHPGYHLLEDQRTCQDINECEAEINVCSQICVNKQGTYECHCVNGYLLENNNRTCKAIEQSPDVMVLDGNSILSFSLDGHESFLVSFDDHAHAITSFDILTRSSSVVFASDTGFSSHFTVNQKDMISRGLDQTMLRAPLDMHFPRLDKCSSIAVDWLTNNVYYIETEPGKVIGVCNAKDCAELLTIGLQQPDSLALDANEGFMFWSDWGTFPYISRAAMDGSFRHDIVQYHLVWPNSITLDLVLKRIYWIDAKLNTIESVDYHGRDRRITYEAGPLHSHGLVLFEDYIYWTDTIRGQLHRVNRFTGENQTVVAGNFSIPTEVKINHHLLQPSGKNRCDNLENQCSELCLLTPGGAVCKCPKGMMQVMTDTTKCSNHRISELQSPTHGPSIATNKSTEQKECFVGYCFNEGTCEVLPDGTLYCSCPMNFSGAQCENGTYSEHFPLFGRYSYIWVMAMVIIIILIVVGLVLIIYCCTKRRMPSQDLFKVIKFRKIISGKETCAGDHAQTRDALVDPEAFENPGYNPECDNANDAKVTLEMSGSDDSIDSAFQSCRIGDGDDFSMCKPLRLAENYDSQTEQ